MALEPVWRPAVPLFSAPECNGRPKRSPTQLAEYEENPDASSQPSAIFFLRSIHPRTMSLKWAGL